jgi:hypothetical protein
MPRNSWIVLAAMMSFSALAEVNFAEKQKRVEFLENFSNISTLDVEAYKRELNYEKLGLSHEVRAENESNLLTSKIQQQVVKAYDAALELHGNHAAAINEVKTAINKDLELADPEIKDELKDVSEKALQRVEHADTSQNNKPKMIHLYQLKSVKHRAQYLNQETEKTFVSKADIHDYFSKDEILANLVADSESARWVSTTNMTVRTSKQSRVENKISLQVKIEFLGVSLEAGPYINFKREIVTNATIMTEGLNPVLLNDGNFDFWKRDASGKILVEHGKPVKRFISFSCDADLNFESEYTGVGGFKYAGLGTETTVSRKYVNTVNLTSRRVYVPEYVSGKTTTIQFLSDLCQNDFLNAHFSNKMTVKNSLETMMKNVVSGLTFSNPRTQCALDEHCFNWYNHEIIGLVRIKNYPRCVEDNREKFRSCGLRGLEGQKCAIVKNGKRISDGSFEFICDRGLKCVQTKSPGWFKGGELYQYAEGACRPINPRTYRAP